MIDSLRYSRLGQRLIRELGPPLTYPKQVGFRRAETPCSPLSAGQIQNCSRAESFGSDFARCHQQMGVVMSFVAAGTWLVHSEIDCVSVFLGEFDSKLSRQLCAAGSTDLGRKDDEHFPTESRIATRAG
jgi:hypothetical protein